MPPGAGVLHRFWGQLRSESAVRSAVKHLFASDRTKRAGNDLAGTSSSNSVVTLCPTCLGAAPTEYNQSMNSWRLSRLKRRRDLPYEGLFFGASGFGSLRGREGGRVGGLSRCGVIPRWLSSSKRITRWLSSFVRKTVLYRVVTSWLAPSWAALRASMVADLEAAPYVE